MQLRPIRARIYQPVTRYGVLASDLYYIVAIAVICWSVPLLLQIRLAGVPVFLVAGPGAMCMTYAFCYWRTGKRPLWLQHRLRSLLRDPVERGTLPVDRIKHPVYSWLK
jgi:hypothetical protein